MRTRAKIVLAGILLSCLVAFGLSRMWLSIFPHTDRDVNIMTFITVLGVVVTWIVTVMLARLPSMQVITPGSSKTSVYVPWLFVAGCAALILSYFNSVHFLVIGVLYTLLGITIWISKSHGTASSKKFPKHSSLQTERILAYRLVFIAIFLYLVPFLSDFHLSHLRSSVALHLFVGAVYGLIISTFVAYSYYRADSSQKRRS